MSKVVHLSNEAHARAKQHCQRSGLKMSEWVAILIAQATASAKQAPSSSQGSGGSSLDTATPPPATSISPTAAINVARKPAEAGAAAESAAANKVDEDGMPLYAAPPFWARGSRQTGGSTPEQPTAH